MACGAALFSKLGKTEDYVSFGHCHYGHFEIGDA